MREANSDGEKQIVQQRIRDTKHTNVDFSLTSNPETLTSRGFVCLPDCRINERRCKDAKELLEQGIARKLWDGHASEMILSKENHPLVLLCGHPRDTPTSNWAQEVTEPASVLVREASGALYEDQPFQAFTALTAPARLTAPLVLILVVPPRTCITAAPRTRVAAIPPMATCVGVAPRGPGSVALPTFIRATVVVAMVSGPLASCRGIQNVTHPAESGHGGQTFGEEEVVLMINGLVVALEELLALKEPLGRPYSPLVAGKYGPGGSTAVIGNPKEVEGGKPVSIIALDRDGLALTVGDVLRMVAFGDSTHGQAVVCEGLATNFDELATAGDELSAGV
ncbi:hypothetical protein HMN09_01417100 [Mycena chlorophos]|uniref:Uncharacterized protein n=1 Tax=Mycena chlorophos TaxID=658473 RepID=A0A8H6RWK5_MYCCL|nr:hypothetical protein HMN09_01417100 [Mycena chlorophos]